MENIKNGCVSVFKSGEFNCTQKYNHLRLLQKRGHKESIGRKLDFEKTSTKTSV